MDCFSVVAIGKVSAVVDSIGRPKALSPAKRQLLAVLVAAGPEGLADTQVVEELWPETVAGTSAATLRMAVSRLRQDLPEGSLEYRRGWCRLTLAPSEVDVWAIHELATSRPEAGQLVDIWPAMLGRPFAGTESTPFIRAAIAELAQARTALLQSFLDRPEAAVGTDLPRLVRTLATRRLAADDPLGEVVDEAIRLDAAFRPLIAASASTDGPQRKKSGTDIPPAMAGKHTARLAGREDLLAKIRSMAVDGRGGIALHGSGWSGTTATLLSASECLTEDGFRVFFLVPTPETDASFGPILQAVPEFGPIIDDYLASAEPDGIRRSRCYASVLRTIRDEFAEPVCFIIDDAQTLDDQSFRLLQFLSQSAAPHPIICLAGFTEPAASEAEALGLRSLQLEPLSRAAIFEMVTNELPETSAALRRNLVDELLEKSGGAAGYAGNLLKDLDQKTMSWRQIERRAETVPARLSGLSEAAMECAVTAAILAEPVGPKALRRVTGLSDEAAAKACAQLVQLGVLDATDDADTYRWSGEVPVEVAKSLSSPQQLKVLHLRAAAESQDVHRIAILTEAALPLTTVHHSAAAHIRSARAHLEANNPRGAASGFSRAQQLSHDELTARDLVEYAAATDLSGGDGTAPRLQAFQVACDDEDWLLAFDAAACGLPEAEHLDGDPVRVDLLTQVRTVDLTRPNKFLHALTLSRQLVLLGDHNSAHIWAEKATGLATSAAERARVWLSTQHGEGWLASGADFDEVHAIADTELKAEVIRACALRSITAGQFDQARAKMAELAKPAAAPESPTAKWLTGLLNATLFEDAGNLEEADRMRGRVASDARAFGLSGVVGAQLAQQFFRAWLFDQHGAFVALLESEASDASSSLLARAAYAAALAASGEADRAVAEAFAVLLEAKGSRFESAIAAIVSDAGRLSPGVAKRCTKILEPRIGTSIIVGAGVVNIGPVEGALARLQSDPDRALQYLESAKHCADSWNSVLWRTQSRLRLFVETGDECYATEAAEIAAGTDLEVLVERAVDTGISN